MLCLQDKHAQKHHFAAAGVPVAPFADIDSEAALQAAAADFGFPLMLKSKRCAAQQRYHFAHAAERWLALQCPAAIQVVCSEQHQHW